MSNNADKVVGGLATLGGLWMIFDGLRTGTVQVPAPMTNFVYSRSDRPFAYWVTMIVLMLVAILGATIVIDPPQ